MPTAVPTDEAGYNTLTTSVMEKWYNKEMMQDAVFEAVPLFNIVNSLGLVEKSELPHDLVVRVLFDKAEGVVPFNGYDVVPTVASRGAQAALFRVAQYSGPLQMSMVEEMELTSPQAFADAILDRIEQLELTFAEELARDMYGGNFSNAKRILGLEDVCYAVGHRDSADTQAGTDTDPIRKKWQVRQQTGSYGGITRAAWTPTARGTGWEANVMDGGSATGAFGLSSGVPNNFTKRFGELYSVGCTHGTRQPNVILMSPQPYSDYENMCIALEQPRRDSATFGNFTFGKDTLMFRKAIVIQDEFAETQTTQGGAAAGSQNIYLLNTKYLSLCVDSRMDFSMGPARGPHNQHASVRYMYWRGQWKVKNPRFFGRVFDYNNTGA